MPTSRHGTILVAPPDHHLTVQDNLVKLGVGPRENGHRPSVDVLFSSVAEVVGSGAVGVLLTGMGNDGALGLLKMRRAGAITIAQDEATCVVYGMPREAVRMGAAAQVLPLPEIAEAMLAGRKPAAEAVLGQRG